MDDAQYPYLILTLRRTGGTSLTGFLSKVSDFPTIEHEPFNRDRKLGQITRSYERHLDPDRLRAEIDAALAARPNLKHCVEVVPMAVTRALLEACRDKGYRFLVLTRRDEVSRMVSLALAVATGVWGPKQADKVYPRILSGKHKPQAVDLAAARKMLVRSASAMGQTLTLLRNRGLAYRWLVFEELYKGDEPVRDQARDIAAHLGIAVAEDDPRLEIFAARQGQNSAQIEPFVPGTEALREMLRKSVVT